MRTIFTHVGKGCVVNTDKVLAIIQPRTKSAEVYRTNAARNGMLIDATKGKRVRSIIVLQEGTVIVATLSYETLMNRMNGKTGYITKEEREEELRESDEEEEVLES